MTDLAVLLAHFTAAALLCAVLTGLLRLVAPRLGLVDRPRPDRWHRRPVPRLGGVAIYLTVSALVLIAGPMLGSSALPAPEARVLLVAGTAIFLVGLVDDLFRLENRPKLLLLILCAVIPGLLGVRFVALSAALGVPLAVLWILGTTNAFNWLDNMDGVSAGVAAIAGLVLAASAAVGGHSGVAWAAAVVAGAAAGFLAHNFPPARIFMGDGGSGFLGLTLATLAVLGTYREVSNLLLAVLLPGLILAVPLFDTAVVAALRALHRRPLFHGGKDHPAHRLVAMGLPERRAVLLLYALSATSGAVPLAATWALGPGAAVSVAVVLLVGFGALGLVLAEVRVYTGTPPAGLVVLPAPFQNKRWLGLMLLDTVLVAVAFVLAHLLRFEGQLPPAVGAGVGRALPLVLAVKMAAFYAAGAYRGAWRYAGLPDMVRLLGGVAAASVASGTALALVLRLQGISRAALIIDALLTLLLLAGARLSLRFVRESLAALGTNGRRALIFGAGAGGVLLLQELRQNPALGYRPVGFVDDDPAKQGLAVQGVPVLGGRAALPDLIRRHDVDEVLLAAPSCPPAVVCEVVEASRRAGVEARRLVVGLTRAEVVFAEREAVSSDGPASVRAGPTDETAPAQIASP